jgi:hypothetical protein
MVTVPVSIGRNPNDSTSSKTRCYAALFAGDRVVQLDGIDFRIGLMRGQDSSEGFHHHRAWRHFMDLWLHDISAVRTKHLASEERCGIAHKKKSALRHITRRTEATER